MLRTVFPTSSTRSVWKQFKAISQTRFFSEHHEKGKDITTRKYPKPLRTKRYGIDIQHDPLWNKSLAFDIHERDRLGLRGLLPPVVRTLEGQVARTIGHIRRLPDNVAKNLYLQELHNRNETLYHRVLLEYIDEIAPLVYTPTVGVVCQQFGHRFNRSRGMYFSVQDRGMFSTMVHNWPHDDVHVIVVTDGSRILGLGDLGAHGMGIPIGKLALYCAAGGIAPHRVLPVMLDVGTNNEALLNDPDYIGEQKPRLEGEAYFEFLEEFMQAVFSRWPDVIVQFEDFETAKAVPLLEKYRHRYRCFNDDIQGTGCVTLAGVLSATKIAGRSFTESRILCAGMGSAGLGVCTALYDGLIAAGLSPAEARSRFVLCSVDGTFGKADMSRGDPNHRKIHTFVPEALAWRNDAVSDGMSLLEATNAFKPNIILGLTAQGGIFKEDLLRAMNSHCTTSRPIVMPMSNPTAKAECTAEQAYLWTDGRAVVATGSPFPSTTLPDGRVLHASQCNNMYIFPGLGLAASVAGISTISDGMLYAAAFACADSTTNEDIVNGKVFPDIKRIREVSLKVAVKVIEEGIREGQATKIKKRHMAEGIENLVRRKMYYPTYVPLL